MCGYVRSFVTAVQIKLPKRALFLPLLLCYFGIMDELRTWIEIDKNALRNNVGQFLKLIPKRTRFMAVVKSNAYGHGLTLIAQLLQATNYKLRAKLWFGVDSIVEALRLREEGIKNPILVLGSTLPSRMPEAEENDITLTISNFESLISLIRTNKRIDFHLKIDTGMNRQGFLPQDAFKLIKLLKRFSARGGSASGGKLTPQGIYTHFAAAKDIAYPTYTLEQLKKFNVVVAKFKKAGFKNLIKHAAASGGTILFPQSHLDMVRVGMGVYGYWPSNEARITYHETRNAKVILKPVLTWKTAIAEIKEIPAGSFVGYDLTERVSRKTKIAVLPIGYWHGYDRGLSGTGEVLIRGKRAKVLGRVSMDMTVVDVTGILGVKVGNTAVLIGKQGKDAVWADELALKIGTSQYEFLTRINPLIERIVI